MSTPSSPFPEHPPVVPPPPLAGLLRVSIPLDGARARRTLWALALGHLAIAVAVVPVALLVAHDGTATSPVTGAVVIAGSQMLSCWKIGALARVTTDHLDVDHIARSLRRSEMSFVFTLFPGGTQWVLVLNAQPTTTMLILFAILIVALALEVAFISWTGRRANQYGRNGAVPDHARLPPGTGTRIWTVQARSAGILAILGGVATILLVATMITEASSGVGTSPAAALVQIVAAIAATAVPLLPIRSVLLVRTAVVGDTAHLPTLRRARAYFVRAGSAAAPLTALVIASLPAAPAGSDLALVRSILTIIVLGIIGSFFIELDRFRIGDIPRRFRRQG